MDRFAQTCEAVAATARTKEKIRLVGEYLRGLPTEEAALAVVFFTGRPFPRIDERVLGTGGSLIWQVVSRLARSGAESFESIYRKHGDLGAMTEEVLTGKGAGAPLSLVDVRAAFDELAKRRGADGKLPVLEELLRRAQPAEAKYIVKIITGDLRIGLKESLVELAIAHAFANPTGEVQRANMLTGDIGATPRLARSNSLGEARLRLFHPIGFMLASAAETAAEAMEYFPDGAQVEDKYDGIRAQAHKLGERVKLFSRTLDEIGEFPELLAPLAALPGEFILDGEIVGWRDGRPLPFTQFQKRLGRKAPDLQGSLWPDLAADALTVSDVPAVYVVFDLLYCDGMLLLDRPLSERRRRLETLLANTPQTQPARRAYRRDSDADQAVERAVRLAPATQCRTAAELQRAFDGALARGNEGVMTKAPGSAYTPGRRGQAWLKLKRPLATLDVVVTAVEYGHGKRHGVLSDYTFSVRSEGEDRLVTIGKAYSGLTNAEIAELTEYFKQHTLTDQGFRREVEPTVVMEVAFNNIQRSSRHQSGYALRFPRIVRLRPDKPVAEIDTLERVKELYRRSPGVVNS
ncbi:MAG TPA: ATP-dependent DNA ligase [Terriglobia bacterium]|nr:ATP-dependent DNA ligase [Terriglobia bacterium]